MLARDLMAKLGNDAPLPSVLLFCPGTAPFNKEAWEPLLAERALDALVARYVDPSLRDLAYTAFYADETSAGNIVLEAQTLPFLADRRVIVVRNAERYMNMSGEKGSAVEPLIEYFKSPNESTLLLFVANKSDKRKKFYTACKAAGDVVECPQLEDNELAAWIRHEAEKQGKRIDGAAVDELIHRAGGRLGDVANALTLVGNYIGVANPQIRSEDVIAACADVAEESIWNLTDAIANSDTASALRTLHQLFDLGKSADEILGTINWLLENAYQAVPETPFELKSKYVARKVAPLLRKLELHKLRDALTLVTRTHFLTRTTGTDRELLLEVLVTKLAMPFPKRAPARR